MAFACALAAACSKSSSGPPPTPPPTTTPPTVPPNTWSIGGAVVETVSGAPISGAQIAPSWSLAAVSSGADGGYELGSSIAPPAYSRPRGNTEPDNDPTSGSLATAGGAAGPGILIND